MSGCNTQSPLLLFLCFLIQHIKSVTFQSLPLVLGKCLKLGPGQTIGNITGNGSTVIYNIIIVYKTLQKSR